MASSQQVVWTLLPNGASADGTALKASVLVTPRLNADGGMQRLTLDAYGDWQDWPAVIRRSTFTVLVDGKPQQTTPAISTLDSRIWKALFPKSTFVRPYEPDTIARFGTWLGHPAAALAKNIEAIYAQHATTAVKGIPTKIDHAVLALHSGLLGFTETQRQAILQRVSAVPAHPAAYLKADQTLASVMKTPRVRRKDAQKPMSLPGKSLGASAESFTGALDQLWDYHRPGPKQFAASRAETADEFLERTDFHQIASNLAQYQNLVRAVGLVIDLEFVPTGVAGGNHVIQIKVNWPKSGLTKPDVYPPVAVILNGTVFEALPKDPNGILTGRWLKLGHPEYSIVKMRVDAAALRYDGYLNGLENELGVHATKAAFLETTHDDIDFVAKPATSTIPALQSGGLQLTHDNHADVVASRFARATELETACAKQTASGPNAAPTLNAEDVVRGYRIDVFDTIPNAWFSLNLRDGTYTFLNDTTIPAYTTTREEGMVGVGAATQTDSTGKTVTRLTPFLLAWQGWSLAAKKPGDPDQAPVAGAPLATVFRPSGGSLPMLRFGRTYRMRVRVVDLAGNSADFQSTGTVPDYGSDSHLYCRYEPVGSPDLALVKASGGSVELPHEGESMGVVAIHTFNATPDINSVPSSERARRVVIPPRVDRDFAEIEGALDTGNSLDPVKVQQAAAWPDGNLQQAEERPRQPTGRGRAVVSAQKPAIYSCFPENGTIPYLVDSWAVAAVIKVDYVPDSTLAALRVVQSNAEALANLNVASVVPATIFASKLAAVNVEPTLGMPGSAYQPSKWGSNLSPDINFDILTGAPVPYQAATTATVIPSASAFTAINAVHAKHVAGHIDEPFSMSDVATAQLALTSDYAKGPPDELARLHVVPFYGSNDVTHMPSDWPHARPFMIVAVENGQAEPVFDTASREFRVPLRKGERVFLKVSSLIAQDMLKKMAAWWQFSTKREPPPEYATLTAKGRNWLATPWRTIELVHATQKPLVTPDLGIAFDRELHSKPATLFFGVNIDGPTTVRVDLFGRWQEPVDDPAADGPAFRDHQEQVLQKMVPRVQKASDYFYIGGQHTFPDTRYRRVTYRLEAISRFREFMPDNIRSNDDNLKVVSNDYRFWVPNAAPPPAPKVLYVVPTFGWNRSATQSTRYGRGLRVYLDRPWFVSGYGEMLAVVLPPQNASPGVVDKSYVTQVTQWGDDPIWMSGKVASAAPARADFPAAVLGAPVAYPNVDGALPEEATDWPKAAFKLANLPLPAPPRIGAPVAINNVAVDVAPHVVGYDAERKLWYADILINPPRDAYYPFVRLALARYHPLSLPGAHLSSVVLTEFQQLVPDRMAVVTRGGSSATVAIYGTLPQDGRDSPKFGQFVAEVQVLAAGGDPDLDWMSAGQTTGGLRLDPNITASGMNLVQQYPSAAHQPQGHAGWPAVAQTGAIPPQRLGMLQPDEIWRNQQQLLWQATVPLPGAPPGGKRRLLITESESYRTTEDSPDFDGRRIVYLDTIEI